MGFFAIFKIIGTAFSWLFRLFIMKNKTDMQDAKKNQQDENAKNVTNNAIEKRDTKQIRNELAD